MKTIVVVAAIAATGQNITEVADRFHLNMNMSDCVTKVIGSHYDEYRSAVRPEEVQETPKVDSRQVMFKEVKELQAEGLNIAQISSFMEIKEKGFPSSSTPFYDHYSYMSDGHHGHCSRQEVRR